MPSVNKQSLRDEFDQLKKSFDTLSAQAKVTPEVTSLFQAMILLFESPSVNYFVRHWLGGNEKTSIKVIVMKYAQREQGRTQEEWLLK